MQIKRNFHLNFSPRRHGRLLHQVDNVPLNGERELPRRGPHELAQVVLEKGVKGESAQHADRLGDIQALDFALRVLAARTVRRQKVAIKLRKRGNKKSI